jgi:hypothetical protein
MAAGRHYAEFDILGVNGGPNVVIYVGVVDSDFDPATEASGIKTEGGWGYAIGMILGSDGSEIGNGALAHKGKASFPFGVTQSILGNPGQAKEGDNIGLLLDFVEETLSLYRNGKWVGVLLQVYRSPYTSNSTQSVAQLLVLCVLCVLCARARCHGRGG